MSTEVQSHNSEKVAIELSDKAREHVIKYLDKREHGLGLRLSLSKTGCSGLSYVVDYVDDASKNDLEFAINENYRLFVEKKSYPLLKGVTIDYVKQGLNYKFIFTNPNQTGACGCGESFTVE